MSDNKFKRIYNNLKKHGKPTRKLKKVVPAKKHKKPYNNMFIYKKPFHFSVS